MTARRLIWVSAVVVILVVGLLITNTILLSTDKQIERVIPAAPGKEIRVYPGATVGSAFYVRGHLCPIELTHEECKAAFP